MTNLADPDAGRDLARHLAMELVELETGGDPVVDGSAPVQAGWVEHGDVTTGVLLALADGAAGLCGGLASLPGWVVTTSLTMRRLLTGPLVGPVRFRADVVRAGRHAVVTRYRGLDDGRGGDASRLVAEGVLTSAVLQPEGGPPVYERPLRLRRPETPPAAVAWRDYCRISTADDGVHLEVWDGVRNPWGIVHGGALAALIDVAARHLATGSAPAVTTDAVVHYLAPARHGPLLARGAVVGHRSDGALVRVALYDAGAGDRLTTTAVVTVRPSDELTPGRR